ncbi:tetratricopeptide repeat protein [Aquimarina megaterium]|uniref:tetratricopeptide repeat protein n=1 Tax=Aquimarina megaterium TaxID=1443666 RepID=UPI000944575E|nr:tetratricopeptide repeat protein [Aquimarina megaterium]
MKLNVVPKSIYRNVFILVAVLIGYTMAFLSQNYGPLEDTRIHQDHGVRVLNYFKGIDETAALSPIDDQGNYYDVNKDIDSEHHGMNGFGGFFDLSSNFLHQFFSFVGVYEFKNFINSIFGFLLFLFCGLLGKELGGWKVGLFTLIFVVLTPVMFGYSMNNPKDIPAATFYIFSLFHIVKLLKELPRISLKRAFFLILNISILINIRIIGLIAIGYVLLAVLLWWLLENYQSNFKKIVLKDTLLLAGKTIGVCILAYLAVSIFWPYAHTNPIKVPVEMLFKTSEFRGFENLQIFEGNWQSSFNVPWYYAIKNLFIITMPLHVFIGFFLIPLLYYKNTNKNMLYVSIVLFTTVFPMLLVIFGKPNSHDGSRQFMFSVLPIVVLSAFSWGRLIQLMKIKSIKLGIYAILFLLLLQPLRFMIQYHPMQALYFSPIIGGVGGAYGNYEIDYYGVAIKPALDWLEKNVGDKDNPPRIRMYYGSQTKVKYHLDKSPNLEYVLTRRDSPDWDYSIVMLAEGKYKKDIKSANWSPENTVHEIKVDGAPICFIIKNKYEIDKHLLETEQRVSKTPSVNGYIGLSLLYYKKKDFFKSIEASKKAVSLDPNNSIAYNNLCSAYNNLLMYHEAKIACEKSLSIQPETSLTKNNLSVSLKGVDRRKNKKLALREYLSLSYNYYKLGYFDKCIEVSMELLELEPNSVVAYNNICSSYIALGGYEKAIEACNKALEIDPNHQLVKNNLNWAKSKLNP